MEADNGPLTGRNFRCHEHQAADASTLVGGSCRPSPNNRYEEPPRKSQSVRSSEEAGYRPWSQWERRKVDDRSILDQSCRTFGRKNRELRPPHLADLPYLLTSM
jgi:hypothetical protein